MSRIGKLVVSIPKDVVVDINGLSISVSGPKGKLLKSFFGSITVLKENDKVIVKPLNNDKHSRAMWGTVRSIINNMIQGVSNGFTKELEIKGVGYAASLKGNYLNLALGKSHNTKIVVPSDIQVTVSKTNAICLFGIDKQALGQFAALIIKQRPAEHYKEKGIKIKGQYIQLKESKKN
ncbi:ribosomal protein L6 [Orientia chuto str. Dubai]|uniref:50S ribosomal protein L6 n=1 Tax=Orientia chuto str. Dubai TaxID=1359168 RepID=A0A0F3MIG8_9RICK|nr:50S ribosomal protein L6 [Candidatus Orientia mediorientalis]KJV55262.1 ribosomal protein L6 [Orientia chuto str. Dubai]